MRFFSLFIFTYVISSNLINNSSNLTLDRDTELFSNVIRVKIDNIPYKNPVVIKKFDIADFQLKKKPKIYNYSIAHNTDSEINHKKTEKNEFLDDKYVFNNSTEAPLKNDIVIEVKKNSFDSKNFIKIANNLDEENKVELLDTNILDTINKAVNFNPKIKAQLSNYESSKENIRQVYASVFPSIEMNINKGYKDTDSSTVTTTTNETSSPEDISINLEQNLYTGGKLTAEANKAKNNLLIEEENLRLARYEVILDAALAYLDVLENEKLIELNKLKEEKFKNDFESIELLVKVGNASQSDLVFAQSKLVQIAAEKIQSVNNLKVTKANYKKVVGDALPNRNLMEPELNKTNFPSNFDDALSIAIKKNPRIKIAELQESIARLDVKSNFADALPNISLDAEYQSSNDATTKGSSSETAEITANITVPLFKGGKNLSKIKQAKLIAKKVRYELENEKNEVTQTVNKSWADFQTSETLLKAANINIEAKKLILEGVEQEARLGIKSYIDMLQSKEDLIDAEFNKIKATKRHIFSALQLKADIGELSLKDLYI